MKKVVNVTKEDIANGHQTECDLCPIALALKRVFKKASWVSVDGFDAEIYSYDKELNSHVVVAALPAAARRFVTAFDAGEIPVKPFKFTADFK